MTLFSGDTYEGNWKDDKQSGNGTYSWNDGRKYVGEWENGQQQGSGIEYASNGDIVSSTQ